MIRNLVRRSLPLLALLAVPASGQTLDQTIGGCNGVAPLRTIQANPSTYRSLVPGLKPGDRLLLAAGTYTQGLYIHNLNGQPGRCIVVEGPASGSPALFIGSDLFNTVSIKNASYIAVRNLELDGMSRAGDGVKAEAPSTYAHHITLEWLKIRRHNKTVQTVGISTKSPAWNWVIRYVTIETTGTGLYLGSSDGSLEFVNGLIEHNLIHQTLGYNAELKHQKQRRTALGIPSSGTTIIRHNVFVKETGSLSGIEARPNLLVGHWPLSGAGSTDTYQIYGNLFYQNPYEALFQGEGNVALHHNLFVNRSGPAAVRIQRHNSTPRRVEIFSNTIVAAGTGITVYGGDTAYVQRVAANAVFAGTPLTGGVQVDNVKDTYATAGKYLNAPGAPLGTLDLYPKAGMLQGTAVATTGVTGFLEWDLDFNRLPRLASFRGAYAGDAVNPGWQPALAIKP